MNPLVSIVVPCYNQAQYLSENLNSVLEQEYPTWECIIVNDGSPDNTEEIALEWCAKDSRFKYYKKENGGVSLARNYGIHLSKGEFILPLDGDDMIDKEYLKEAIQVFNKYPDTKLVYCNSQMFGLINKKHQYAEFDYYKMITGNMVHCSALYRRSDFMKTSGYNPNMNHGLEDWDFWLYLLDEDSKVVKLDGYYLHYRIKKISRSAELKKYNDKNEEMILQIFKNHTDLYLNHLNPIRSRIEADYFKSELEKATHTMEYKIGKLLCLPIRLLQQMVMILRNL